MSAGTEAGVEADLPVAEAGAAEDVVVRFGCDLPDGDNPPGARASVLP